MNKVKFLLLAISVVLGLMIIRYLNMDSSKKTEDINYLFSNFDQTKDFKKAIGPKKFVFPDDFGSHDLYETEWWYYTGNLFNEKGRQFGYQLTFFRRGLPVLTNPENRNTSWATNQIYLAHLSVTDVENSQHYQFKSLSRGGEIGLAGTKSNPLFQVWLYDWSVIQTGQDRFTLHAAKDDIAIDLNLLDMKGVVFNGDRGLSQKGPEIGNASYYFSQTRLKTEGTMVVNGESLDVTGFSWMDHEFGTSALGKGQVGWDWFSIQLNSNEELMLFQIRDAEGNISQYSSGSYITSDGKLLSITNEDFKIEVLDTWKTSDGYEYPSSWSITSEKLKADIKINPMIKDQENKLFFRYWEGSVHITGFIDDQAVNGFGYVELTGYAQSIDGVF